MNAVTLKQLRYLDALARHGHFGRAAEACAISQPALSMQIKELEDALGVVLVERSARQVRLTRFGEEAVRRAREILKAVDELADVARASRDGLAGRLRLGMIPTVAPYLLPAVISALGDAFPGLDVHVREAVTPRLMQDLSDARLDAVIVALPVAQATFTEVPLLTEAFLLVQPLGVEAPATLAAIQGTRLLLLEEGHCLRDQALAFCSVPSTAPRDVLDASSLSTLVQMVGAGMGVTLIPEMAVPVEARSAPVAVARFDDAAPMRTIGMVWRTASPLAPRLAEMAQVVRKAAERCRPLS